tara:strand:- start:343 stop:579 length:237 start_codon:yes stop_codon:yes gene_type:complete
MIVLSIDSYQNKLKDFISKRSHYSISETELLKIYKKVVSIILYGVISAGDLSKAFSYEKARININYFWRVFKCVNPLH